MNEIVLSQSTQRFLKTAKWRPALQMLFTWLAEQEGEDEETEVGRVESELSAETSDETPEYLLRIGATWLDVFKGLDDKAGRLILGRHGRVTRFRWNDPPASFAQAALAFMNGGAVVAAAADAVAPAGAAPPRLQRYSFPLRSGLSLEVSVPEDVTREEIARLADFIRLLPSKS